MNRHRTRGNEKNVLFGEEKNSTIVNNFQNLRQKSNWQSEKKLDKQNLHDKFKQRLY